MSFRGLALAVAATTALAALPTGARADDAAERAARVRATFPAPSAELGVSFPFVMVVRGVRIATGRFSAAPDAFEEKRAWKVAEVVDSEASGLSYEASGWLAPDLRVLRWESKKKGPRARHVRIDRTAAGLVRTSRPADADPGDADTDRRDVPPDASAGFVGLVLFLRAARDSPERYDLPLADGATPEVASIEPAEDSRLEAGATSLATRKNRGRRGVDAIELHRDRDHGTLVAIQLTGKDILFVREDLSRGEPAVDLAGPAASPRAAAGRLLLGMATADRALLRDSIHWPTFVSPIRRAAEARGRAFDEASVQDAVLEKLGSAFAAFRAKWPGTTRAQHEAIVQGALAGATEAPAAEGVIVVRVAVGADQPMRFPVKSVGGVWYVVGVPVPDR